MNLILFLLFIAIKNLLPINHNRIFMVKSRFLVENDIFKIFDHRTKIFSILRSRWAIEFWWRYLIADESCFTNARFSFWFSIPPSFDFIKAPEHFIWAPRNNSSEGFSSWYYLVARWRSRPIRYRIWERQRFTVKVSVWNLISVVIKYLIQIRNIPWS